MIKEIKVKSPTFLLGGGAVGEWMRTTDWSNTPLGAPEHWQQSLKTALQIMLNTPLPMCICWGKTFHYFYNDAYLPLLDVPHPAALGSSVSENGSRIWQDLQLKITAVLQDGATCWNQLLPISVGHNGLKKIISYTFSGAPILNDAGENGGVLCTLVETKAPENTQKTLDIETKYQTLFDSFEEGFCVCEMILDEAGKPIDYRFLEVNPAFEQHSGLHQPIGKTALELVPNLEPHWFELYGNVALTGKPARFTENSKRMERWFEVYAFRMGGAGSLQFGIRFTNITERKKAEQNLVESEERLRMAVSAADLGTWDWNLLTHELIWDQRTRELFGLPPDAFVDMNVFNKGLHPDDLKRTTEVINTALRPESNGEYDIEYRTIGITDHKLRWIRAKGKAFFDEHHKPYRFLGTVLEITSKKMYEEKLIESEELFRNMADNVPVKIWLTDADGQCTYLNKQWYDYTGQAEQEALGLGWTNATHPNDAQKAGEVFMNASQQRIPFYFEYRLRDKHGNYRWKIDSGLPRFNEHGEFVGFIGAVIDIHERKQAEQKLVESEERLQHLADAMPQVVWIADAQGTVNYYNNRVKELAGVVQTATDHWEWQPVVHPDEVTSTLKVWQKAIQEKSNYSHEHRLLMKDGNYRWHLSRAFPILDTNGDVARWYGTATDIDELKQTEQALIASKQYFQKLADAAPVLIWQAGLDKGCYYFNKGWLEFTGRTLEQEQGNGWAEGVHPDDLKRCLEIYTTCFDRREAFIMEYRLRRHDGEYRWLLDHGVPTYDYNSIFTGFLGTCVDIHEKKTAEAQKDAFIHIAGHELRTPLTSLMGYVGLLLREKDNSEQTTQYLRKCYYSALKMRGLVNDFLDFSKVQQGQLSFKITTFNFDKLVSETVENLQLSNPSHQILLVGKTENVLHGDRGRIEQVITNLLNNAIKYSPKQNKVEVTLENAQDAVLMRVKNYGVGIEPDELNHIFEKFHRASNAGKVKGMGLGLYISKEIVDFHKGTITVNSKLGEGSEFIVRLPVEQVDVLM